MNRKGFTLVELLATIVIIAVVMGFVFPSAIRYSTENKYRMYHEYEKMMEEYALVNPLKGAETINLDDLEELDKVKDECDGYVSLISSDPIKYKAHITCGNNYQTDNE